MSARSLFRHGAFVRLWLVGALNSTARWLEMLVVALFVFEASGSAFLVAAMMLLRTLPLAVFGVVGGVLAERLAARTVLLVGALAQLVISATLALLAATDQLAVWHTAVAAFVSGMVWAADFPVRRPVMGEVVGAEHTARAMSLDTIASAGTRALGPLLGGTLLAATGLSGAFALGAALFAVCVAVLIGLRLPQHASPPAAAPLPLATDLAAVRHDPVLMPVLAVTVVFNVWAFPVLSMVPVIATDLLQLGPARVGLFASLEGIGSFLGALALLWLADNRHARRLFTGSVIAFLLLAVPLASAPNTMLASAMLFAMGITLAAFAAMQSALILLNSSAERRRRMMGLLSVCIGTGPIGFAYIGLMADWLGVATACIVLSLQGLVAMLACALYWPRLWSPQPAQQPPG